MATNQVEPAMRAVMGGVKRFYDHVNGTATSTGSSNAYVLTYTVAPGALVAGDLFAWVPNFSNTGSASLNINSLGALNILRPDGTATQSGDILNGAYTLVVYTGSAFRLLFMPGIVSAVATGGSFSGNITISMGSYLLEPSSSSVAAAGTTQGTATALTAMLNNVTSVASGSGVQLPAAIPGMTIKVWNNGSNALNVYPPNAAQIDTLGTNFPYVLQPSRYMAFDAFSSTVIFSETESAIYG